MLMLKVVGAAALTGHRHGGCWLQGLRRLLMLLLGHELRGWRGL
jgi:hypothetical protein